MNLRKQIQVTFLPFMPNTSNLDKLETICDEFAIGFAEWIDVQIIENPKMYYDNTTKELLQIYKDIQK